METRYSRAQKDEALEVFRKQLANGSVMSGEMQELFRRLNIPTAILYGWKVELQTFRPPEWNKGFSCMSSAPAHK